MRGQLPADISLIARTCANHTGPRELRRLHPVDQQHVARVEHADSRCQTRIARHTVEHRFCARAETQIPQCSVSERNGFQADLVTARVFIPRQKAPALQTRKDPGTTAPGNPQLAADLGVSQAAGRLLYYVEQQQRTFERVCGCRRHLAQCAID